MKQIPTLLLTTDIYWLVYLQNAVKDRICNVEKVYISWPYIMKLELKKWWRPSLSSYRRFGLDNCSNSLFKLFISCIHPARAVSSLAWSRWRRKRGRGHGWMPPSSWGWKNWPPKPTSHLLFVIGPHI